MTALRAGTVLASVALSLTAAPACAHETGGDNPTNVRGLTVATAGEGTNMSLGRQPAARGRPGHRR